jgi:dTDP-4-amino-4,6-dideoxygalactose transaminase
VVPSVGLKIQHANLRKEILNAVGNVIDSGSLCGGAFVERFERQFATYCGNHHAVGVSSGTDALWLALLAMGIGHGDEVITVPNSFIATVEAIERTGATTVFADVDDATLTLDPAAFRSAITPRTRAVIVVHLFGRPADMDPILAIAANHGLAVIEDAAQAHGAEYRGRRVGSIGDAACFSFYPTKNLGACGEAGAVVTGDAKLAARIRCLANHGQIVKYHHDLIGWNCRMDAILSLKLPALDQMNELRRDRANDYRAGLADCPSIQLPPPAGDALEVYHQFGVRVTDRDRVITALKAHGVDAGIHYPLPIHLQPAFQHLGYTVGSMPAAERSSRELISLPLFPEMAPWQTRHVCRALVEICSQSIGIANLAGGPRDA